MEIDKYKSGRQVKQYHYDSFLPEFVNHPWTGLGEKTEYLLNEVSRKLGELNAISDYIPDVNFFITMHIAKEATQSSRIEGTKTSIEEAVQAEENIDPEKKDDWQEVQNYIEALNFAIRQLDILPLSNRLLKQTHHKLMQGVRGSFKSPGEFRTSQNWIGGSSLKDASYIPPHWHDLPELMGDLENFINNDQLALPHLVRVGIAHYQFETIHPFLDGNGRLGRLLITLYLVSNNILKKPVLYISDFFERNKQQYYQYLDEARTKNNLGDWLHFFLNGMLETAQNSIETFTAVVRLRREVEEIKIPKLGKKSLLSLRLVNHLYSHPVVDAIEIAKALDIHISTAHRLLQDFERIGILKEKTGFKRNRSFIFESYIRLFDKDETLNNSERNKNNIMTDFAETQLGLFGDTTTFYVNKRGLKFCIKEHIGQQYGLHYDLRLQFNDLWLKSFAIKPAIPMNTKEIATADLVNDHEMSAFRREGTILNEKGEGPVIHFDEGYYTIPGVQNLKELKKALENGLKTGNLNVLFDGYKIKGEFIFRIQKGRSNSEWTIQKKDDEFSVETGISLQGESILTSYNIGHYNQIYNDQKEVLKKLSPEEKTKFIRQNNGESFKYNRTILPERENKLLPYN